MDAQEMERGFQEIWKLFAETRQQFKETDERLDQLFQETDQRFKETDQQFKETDRQFKETDRRLDHLFKETDRKIGDLTGKWSRFVEGLVVPGAERLFRERGIDVEMVSQRVRRRRNGSGMEIDILVMSGEHAVLIEAKSTLSVDDVQEHMERLAKFKFFFPEYEDLQVLGAVAGIVINEGVDRFAYKNGLFVIAQSGNTVHIINDEAFVPKRW